MKYIVNTQHLSIGAAAAVVRALEHHYGERCLDRIEDELSFSSYNIDLVDSEGDWLCKVDGENDEVI